MARSTYHAALRSRTGRLKLPVRSKPFYVTVSRGVRLGYRRSATTSGSWNVEASGRLVRFALADDFEPSNADAEGVGSVLDFYAAQKLAIRLARGGEANAVDPGKPLTVADAIALYRTDLEARGGNPANADTLAYHCDETMQRRTVSLLTVPELQAWRSAIIAKGLKASSALRIGKTFKACLNLAARRDKSILNAAVWREAFAAMPGDNTPPRTNFWLPDAAINAIVRESYAVDPEFGALIDVMAQTGVRESQVRALYTADLIDDDPQAPALMMPTSRKGKKGRAPERRRLRIKPELGKVLSERAMRLGENSLLFPDRIWNMSIRFREVLAKLDLDESLSAYVLRHAAIIRKIKARVPLRVIAHQVDSSAAQIEQTYSRYLDDATADLAMAGMLSDEAPGDNVVPLFA